MRTTLLAFGLAATVACPGPTAAAQSTTRTQNVILVMTDGFRWQEMFGGADASPAQRVALVRPAGCAGRVVLGGVGQNGQFLLDVHWINIQ